jgi:hypothetical protein
VVSKKRMKVYFWRMVLSGKGLGILEGKELEMEGRNFGLWL